jgi:PPOX class probable F420-dependent enzyme
VGWDRIQAERVKEPRHDFLLGDDGGQSADVVWVRRDGDDVLFSTVKGRRKHASLLADPRVSLLVTDVANPYRYAEIRGAATVTDDPQAELIQELAGKYTGQAFATRPGDERVIVRIAPDRVVVYDD